MTHKLIAVGKTLGLAWNVHTYDTELFTAAKYFLAEARSRSTKIDRIRCFTATILFAYMSLEAFANWQIQRKSSSAVEKNRYISSALTTKLKTIVPELTSKAIEFPEVEFKYLSKLRHGLVHREGRITRRTGSGLHNTHFHIGNRKRGQIYFQGKELATFFKLNSLFRNLSYSPNRGGKVRSGVIILSCQERQGSCCQALCAHRLLWK